MTTSRIGTPNPAATSAAQPSDALRAKLQMLVLKKALDQQTQENAELLKALEPKGQVIDIRV